MEPQNNLQKNIGIFFSIIVIVGVLFVTIFWGKQSTSTGVTDQTTSNNSNTSNTIPNPTPTTNPTKIITQTPPVDTPKKSTSVYKDGTYSATGSYMSPGGQDQVTVTLTLKNDLISSVSVTPQASDRTSARYQNMFMSNYQQYVLGKDISSVHLTTVSGSSLTPNGFNDALAQIETQAKA